MSPADGAEQSGGGTAQAVAAWPKSGATSPPSSIGGLSGTGTIQAATAPAGLHLSSCFDWWMARGELRGTPATNGATELARAPARAASPSPPLIGGPSGRGAVQAATAAAGLHLSSSFDWRMARGELGGALARFGAALSVDLSLLRSEAGRNGDDDEVRC